MPEGFQLQAAAIGQLRKLPDRDRERILRAIESLPAGEVRSLAGRAGLFRLRVGDWRALFELAEGDVIVVYRVAWGGAAYKP